jgi:hypothetical protein
MAQDVESDLASITVDRFNRDELTLTGEHSDRERLAEFMTQRYGPVHGYQAVVHGTRAGGLFLVAIGSQLPDDMVGETMRTIQKAASNQLTGKRPGVLCVKFEAITADELVDIAREDPPSSLRIGVHSLWQSTAMGRVSHVVFMADGKVEQKSSGAWSRLGASYVFENPKSVFKDDPRLQLFVDG